MIFLVKLQPLHKASGKSAYRVAKDLGIGKTTVARYIGSERVEVHKIETNVVRMAEYYGANWKDVVEAIEPEDEESLVAVA